MGHLPEHVVCATSTASQGNMDFRFGDSETVEENRTNFLKSHGILFEDHIAMRCTHGDSINNVSSFHPGVGVRSQEEQIESEVLVTQEKNLALMLFTADCQPTCLYDPVTQTIALAHISRQTLCNNLSTKTVTYLKDELCVEPENLIVYVGPSIQKESYSFLLPLDEVHPKLHHVTEERNGYAYIDLPAAHKEELLSLGIKEENITISKEDTASEKYFSYYKAKKNDGPDPGRMATILMLR